MRSLLAVFIATIIAAISFGCKKQSTGTESDLYGTWVKGSSFGDTLWFMKKNGQNIVRITESNNPLLPVYSEKEYKYKDGALSIKVFAPTVQDYYDITSFTWIDAGKEFTVQSTQLYLFMSSITTFKYRRI